MTNALTVWILDQITGGQQQQNVWTDYNNALFPVA